MDERRFVSPPPPYDHVIEYTNQYRIITRARPIRPVSGRVVVQPAPVHRQADNIQDEGEAVKRILLVNVNCQDKHCIKNGLGYIICTFILRSLCSI